MIYDAKGSPVRREIGFLSSYRRADDRPGTDLVASSEIALEREYEAEDGE